MGWRLLRPGHPWSYLWHLLVLFLSVTAASGWGSAAAGVVPGSFPAPSGIIASQAGEASHPGPLQLSTLNLTCLHTHKETVVPLVKGIWAWQETKATAHVQRSTETFLRKAKRFVVWGAPLSGKLDPRNGSVSLTTSAKAGVAIVSDMPLVKRPTLSVQRQFYQEGRLARAVCRLKATSIFITNIYGYSGARTNVSLRGDNEKLVEAALSDADATRPEVVLADLNMEPLQSPRLRSLLARGWVDVALWEAQRRNVPPAPTYQRSTRIDVVLLNPAAAVVLLLAETWDPYDVPNHSVVSATLDLERPQDLVRNFKVPDALPVAGLTLEDVELASLTTKDAAVAAMDAAVACGEVHMPWRLWHTTAEACIVRALGLVFQIIVPGGASGRGEVKSPEDLSQA